MKLSVSTIGNIRFCSLLIGRLFLLEMKDGDQKKTQPLSQIQMLPGWFPQLCYLSIKTEIVLNFSTFLQNLYFI